MPYLMYTHWLTTWKQFFGIVVIDQAHDVRMLSLPSNQLVSTPFWSMSIKMLFLAMRSLPSISFSLKLLSASIARRLSVG